jgi:hypothetical protein
MIGAGNALDILVAALRGQDIPERVDWSAVIALANHTLLTPTLFSSLERAGRIDCLPHDVRHYLRFIYNCNYERNVRLRSQLCEAVEALNSLGIAPVLLKGAVPLFLAQSSCLPSRMTSDLDIGVHPLEECTARACLEEIGYVRGPVRELVRPEDAAILELRAWEGEGLGVKLVDRNGLSARIPSAQSRARHWIMHDLLKEGDYLRGRIDLRHLYDLAWLAETENVDWRAVRASMPGRRARNALDTQMVTLHRLFGTKVPLECMQRPMIGFHHWRRVFTARHAVVGAPLRIAANLAWGTSRLGHSRQWMRDGPLDFACRFTRVALGQDYQRPKI